MQTKSFQKMFSTTQTEIVFSNLFEKVLKGIYSNYRQCHIEPDWLQIYRFDKRENELLLFRTGTHSDLFK